MDAILPTTASIASVLAATRCTAAMVAAWKRLISSYSPPMPSSSLVDAMAGCADCRPSSFFLSSSMLYCSPSSSALSRITRPSMPLIPATAFSIPARRACTDVTFSRMSCGQQRRAHLPLVSLAFLSHSHGDTARGRA